jgi:hypothetical protein
MQYKSILSLVASITLIQGFVIPDGLENGIYSVNKDKNGNEQIEYVSGFEHSTKSKHRRVPLPSGEIGVSNFFCRQLSTQVLTYENSAPAQD